jgi:hypothetical protein
MSTLTASPAMRATVLDEAELTGLPARVQALARNLALTSISAARNAAGPRAQPKGERGSIGSDKTSPDAARPVARPGQLLAKTIPPRSAPLPWRKTAAGRGSTSSSPAGR